MADGLLLQASCRNCGSIYQKKREAFIEIFDKQNLANSLNALSKSPSDLWSKELA